MSDQRNKLQDPLKKQKENFKKNEEEEKNFSPLFYMSSLQSSWT